MIQWLSYFRTRDLAKGSLEIGSDEWASHQPLKCSEEGRESETQESKDYEVNQKLRINLKWKTNLRKNPTSRINEMSQRMRPKKIARFSRQKRSICFAEMDSEFRSFQGRETVSKLMRNSLSTLAYFRPIPSSISVEAFLKSVKNSLDFSLWIT